MITVLYVAYCSLRVRRCLLHVDGCLPFGVVCRVLVVVWCLLVIVAVCCLLLFAVMCCLLFVVCCVCV